MHDEELGACGVWHHGAGHGKHARSMSQVVFEAILSKFAADGVSRAAHAGAVRTSALDHEAFDNTVEDDSVVEAFLNQG